MIPIAAVVAQAGGGATSDTGVIVAVIGAAAVIVSAIVGLVGQRNASLLAVVEKQLDGLGAILDRLDRKLDEGLARLTDCIDRLYEPPPTAVGQFTEAVRAGRQTGGRTRGQGTTVAPEPVQSTIEVQEPAPGQQRSRRPRGRG